MQREYLKLTRKQICVMFNLKVKTLRNYESKKCSEKYFYKIKNLIENYDNRTINSINEVV